MAFPGKLARSFLGFWFCTIPVTAMGGANTFFLNGSTLLQLCTSQSFEEQAACEGYIIGVQDSIFSGHLSEFVEICYPAGVGTTQLRLQFINHASSNPAKLHFAAEGLVAESVAMIFSCPEPKDASESQSRVRGMSTRPIPKSFPKTKSSKMSVLARTYLRLDT